ncbi:DNA helicase-2 / ATP-dependent DNA helicase PcrA [Actinopolyspora mzabensis]|uniref:DNA helicase-2 / ATP-dependent DNA helicase PcrA n=1 Tax=Actinopolyspora mzabensis TaxID=995066 RepID=A0A1G9AKV3_ACTMZ|nr:DNA helicase-2 / ATP-dependent DNA helicase PcrA [Actinopolyspora mzabensis]
MPVRVPVGTVIEPLLYPHVRVGSARKSDPEVALTDAGTREEERERRHLAETTRLLNAELERLVDSIDRSAEFIQAQKEHLWEHWRDMDSSEKARFRVDVDLSVAQGEHSVERRERVERLLESPYFGRVDFRAESDAESGAHYIGVHNFSDPETQEILIHDWRAPVATLFYDFESGEAHFEAPVGTIHGEITGKRQYKIRGGQLEYMFESSLNIGDDVLRRELGESADDRMKNIVATIQREQNAVIRNETARVLILQGVAGSGKTSIALHRVAFLLYRFKDTLSSDNIMILSPNRVFGDYIADVLPELGEEQVSEIDFDRIAGTFLAKVTGYETFSEQVVKLLENGDEAAAERMRYKATPEFVAELDEWIAARAEEDFTPADVERRSRRLSADWVADAFEEARGLPIFTRLDRVASRAVNQLKQQVMDRGGGKWSSSDAASVRRRVHAMFPYKDALAVYRAFYEDPARRGMFQPLARKRIEYADVFPLIYTMIRTARQEGYGHIRHLVVDEMQDYTPVQYAVLRELFSCDMTILGDSNQSVNPFSSSSLATIHSVFPEADCLELCKSYRSTIEITEFAQRISRNDKLVPIERHGPRPRVVACSDERAQREEILGVVERHGDSEHRSLGIICKTATQAEALHGFLSETGVAATLLDYGSTEFTGGIVVTSAHVSKGLEFDAVVVPAVDDANYADEMDRCMLYIACTRAMHELHLTHEGKLSRFLEFGRHSEVLSGAGTAEVGEHSAEVRVG